MPAALAAEFKLLDTLWRDEPERWVLPNGLTVILRPRPGEPATSVQAWVKTGSIHEGANLGAGLSHFLEHMLFKGTGRRAGRDISREVHAHGGYINAYTSFDRTVYYINLPSEHAPVALDILGDAVFGSTLPAEEVDREKQVILREIDMGLDDPDHQLWQALFEAAYREHPYRQPIIGHRDVFAATSRQDLLDYYQSRYVPNNLILVVAGGYDPAVVRSAIKQAFGAAPRRRLAPVFIPEEPPATTPRVLHLESDVEIVRAGLAWQIPGTTHPDAPALSVLALILGHGDSSILWNNLRERARLVHEIDAVSWMQRDHGLFYLTLVCDPKRRDRALAAVARELRAAATRGFTMAQVRKAMRQLVVAEINGHKTVEGQASRLGAAELGEGDCTFTRSYYQRLRQVTPAAVRRALQRHVLGACGATVTLNPHKDNAAAPVPSKVTGTRIAPLTETLANGSRLVMQPDARLPNLHLRLLCLGGAVFEASGQRGAASLLATLLTRDTTRRSAAQVAATIESAGGSFYPVTGNNTLGLAIEVLPVDVELALELLGDAMHRPKFTQASLDVERDAQIAAIAQDDDDVLTIGRKRLRREFFGDHPLAHDTQGLTADLRALKRGDLAHLLRRLLVGPNVVLSVAGDFTPTKLAPKLRRLLRSLPAAPDFTVPEPKVKLPARATDCVEQQPREQAVVLQGYRGPGVKSADFHIAEVADELFSGMSSRLFERVREEKGLAYYVRAARVIGLQTGMFYFYAGTAPGQETAVLLEIEAEITRMAKGRITRRELADCQTRLIAARRMSLQTNGARAMHAALNTLYGLPLDDLTTYEAAVRTVTVKRLAAFARDYLDRQACTQVVVRP